MLVAGWHGSGKSTVAAALAAEMRLPLAARDEIKEASWTASASRRPSPMLGEYEDFYNSHRRHRALKVLGTFR